MSDIGNYLPLDKIPFGWYLGQLGEQFNKQDHFRVELFRNMALVKGSLEGEPVSALGFGKTPAEAILAAVLKTKRGE